MSDATLLRDGQVRLFAGDSRDVLRELADCSIDSVVTDPPYALVSIQKRFGKEGSAPAQHGKDGLYARASAGFMGKQWDTGEAAFATEFWAEVMRVLKPGGHVLAFGGTRTYHRLACAIEDAGFEIRDQIGWAYGSGFPKSHNQKGDWEGWGTALKPAWEPIVVARKSLDGTNAANLEKWGVGALNIDGCRVAVTGADAGQIRTMQRGDRPAGGGWGMGATQDAPVVLPEGRWPANLIHDGSDEVLAAFPDTASGSRKAGEYGLMGYHGAEAKPMPAIDGDSGSAARFFYCAKASKADRDAGLDGFAQVTVGDGRAVAADNAYQRGKTERKNTHPTVKPTDLMRYLCRLVTPPGGAVLDPFMGSGSTGKAAVLEGFQFVGIEREPEYMPIAIGRIAWAVGQMDRPDAPVVAKRKPANDNATGHIDMLGAADAA